MVGGGWAATGLGRVALAIVELWKRRCRHEIPVDIPQGGTIIDF